MAGPAEPDELRKCIDEAIGKEIQTADRHRKRTFAPEQNEPLYDQFNMARPTEPGELLKRIDEAIVKRNQIADGHSTQPFTTQENMLLYDCAYRLCKMYSSYKALLYEKYMNTLKERIQKKVLPALEDKCGTTLLAEVPRQWLQYMAFAKSVSKIFNYLDYHYNQGSCPFLIDTGRICFIDLVFAGLYEELLEEILCLIGEEREGKQIDRNVLQSSLSLFLQVGGKGSTNYYEIIERAVLTEAAIYYSKLASEWWSRSDSAINYVRKVFQWLDQEAERAEIYPAKTTKTKLEEVMIYVLLKTNAEEWSQSLTTEGFATEDTMEQARALNRAVPLPRGNI